MINERMRRPCTCQTSRAVMIGCQARGARCEARGARSMTGSKAAPEAPRGLVPCRLVMSRAPPTRAARHLCAWLCASTSVEPTWSRVFYAQRSDARRYGYQNMRVRRMYIVRSLARTSRSPRASRATAWGNGGGGAARRAARGPAHRAAPGPGGRSAARAGVRTRSRRGRYVRSRRVDRPGRSRRIRFRMRNGAVQSVRRVITLYTFHYLVHTSVERRQELVCHGMAASECSGSTSKGCSIWTPISS